MHMYAHTYRVWEDPHHGDAWLNSQELLQVQNPQLDPVVAALQLYSDKTVLTMKGRQAHPIRQVSNNERFTQHSLLLFLVCE